VSRLDDDGAAWIWTMAEALYPYATHIVDIYHAREHLHDLANHLAFITPDPAQWLQDRGAELDAGDSQAIIAAARQYPLAGVKADERDTKIGYFEDNAYRMRYADMAFPRHGPHRAARRHLTDSKTQIRRPTAVQDHPQQGCRAPLSCASPMDCQVRHEALCIRVEMEGLHRRAVAAVG
jgi:hypothetical protein